MSPKVVRLLVNYDGFSELRQDLPDSMVVKHWMLSALPFAC